MKKNFGKFITFIFTLVAIFAFSACVPNQHGGEIPGGEIPGDEIPGDEEKPDAPALYQPFLTESLPIIRIKTDHGGDILGNKDNQPYYNCTLSTENCEQVFVLEQQPCEVRVRGNYTANYEKKPFRIKFTEKQNMLGLNGGTEYKNWVLLADYKDSSLSRNALTFYLGNTILGTDGYYTSDYRPVEVYVNNNYRGVYLLAEQQQINATRVNINEAKTDYKNTDIGYFFEYDATYYSEDIEHFLMTYNGIKQLKNRSGKMVTFGRSGYKHGYTIKSDIYDMSQNSYLAAYMDGIFKVAYEAVYNKKLFEIDGSGNVVGRNDYCTVQEAVEAVIDVRSLVDMYLIEEICCDYDVSFSSFYLSLDLSRQGNKKLTFVAPWDFDSSLGLSFSPPAYSFIPSNKALYAADCANPWLILLINEDWFWDMAANRWKEVSDWGVTKNVVELVGTYSEMYKPYYKKNFERWPGSMGARPDGDRMAGIISTFRTQADAAGYLEEWLRTRIEFLDTVFV